VKPALPIEKTARLVARALGVTPLELDEGLRPATEADFAAVVSLRRQVLRENLGWDDEAYLRWRYQFGSPHLATCWVCTRGDEVIGMIGVEALQVSFAGQQSEVHAVMDLMVRPDLDGCGLGVWINQAITHRLTQGLTPGLTPGLTQAAVLAIGSNPNSKGVVARTFQPLPDRRSHTHPLHFGNFMAKRLSRAWLASLASSVVGAGMGLLRVALLWARAPFIRVEQVTQLGPEVERLLARSRRPDRIEVMRTTAGLTHRLLHNPRSVSQVWLARKSGEVVGMVAARFMRIEGGRLALQIMDIVLDPQSERAALSALLARVTADGFRKGAEYLSVTTYDPQLERFFVAPLFKRQAHEYETMAWVCPQDALRQAVEAGAGWSLFDIHTDRDQT